MKPAALEKAETLYRFALRDGSPLFNWEVTLTTSEAEELLDWLPESGMIGPENLPLLQEDIAQARRAHDPWLVLKHFAFSGLKTRPLTSLS